MTAEKINIGIIGFGTVGCGVAKVISENFSLIKENLGIPIVIKKIADIDIKRKRDITVDKKILTTEAMSLIEDPEIDIIVETVGGIVCAKDYVYSAIKNKKHLVTSNKELIAKFGNEIFRLAEKNNVDVRFEGSVGGGIPIIRPIIQCLSANKIEEIIGILNGTTNYILTKMSEENMEFSSALKEAQNRGFAEADPSSDIDAYDPMYKIAILSMVGFGANIPLAKIYREGISKITKKDIEYAKELGYCIKLLAIAKNIDDTLEVKVHPACINILHPLSKILYEYNAIFVRGNAVGNLMFYGKGAGSLPTASAVVGDIIEIARNIKSNSIATVKFLKNKQYMIKNIDETHSRFYIRLHTADKPGVLAKIAKVFGNNNVSIAQAIQKESTTQLSGCAPDIAEIVFITYKVCERNFKKSIKEIKKINVVKSIDNVIRVVDI